MLKELSVTTAHRFLSNGTGPKMAFYKWMLSESFSVRNAGRGWREIRLKKLTADKTGTEGHRKDCRKIGALFNRLGKENRRKREFEKAAKCHSNAANYFERGNDFAMAEKALLMKIAALKEGMEALEGPTVRGNPEAEHTRRMERLKGMTITAIERLAGVCRLQRDYYGDSERGKRADALDSALLGLKAKQNGCGITVYGVLWTAYQALADAGVRVGKPTIS